MSEFCEHNVHESHYCGTCNQDVLKKLQSERDALKQELEIVRDSHKRQGELNDRLTERKNRTLEAFKSLIRAISDPIWNDDRLSYCEHQIDKRDLEEARAFLAKEGENG